MQLIEALLTLLVSGENDRNRIQVAAGRGASDSFIANLPNEIVRDDIRFELAD